MRKSKKTSSFKENGSVKLKEVYSTYVNDSLRADTIKLNSDWGCDFYKNNHLLKTEIYKGHSEYYAEDAAENYIFGIKKI